MYLLCFLYPSIPYFLFGLLIFLINHSLLHLLFSLLFAPPPSFLILAFHLLLFINLPSP